MTVQIEKIMNSGGLFESGRRKPLVSKNNMAVQLRIANLNLLEQCPLDKQDQGGDVWSALLLKKTKQRISTRTQYQWSSTMMEW